VGSTFLSTIYFCLMCEALLSALISIFSHYHLEYNKNRVVVVLTTSSLYFTLSRIHGILVDKVPSPTLSRFPHFKCLKHFYTLNSVRFVRGISHTQMEQNKMK